MGHGHEPRRIRLDRLVIPAGSLWSRLSIIGLVTGLAGIGVSLLLARNDSQQFYFSWLVSFLFFLSIALGGLFFVLVLYATKAGWGIAVRRLVESTTAAIPVLALLFVPVVLGMHDLFHWTHEDAVAADALLQGKQAFLNSKRFLIFAGAYFVIWIFLGQMFLRGSLRQDRTGDEAISHRLIKWSGPAIIVLAVTLSLAAIDWIMSLDPHWYSTMFGVYYFAGCLVGAFAFVTVLAVLLRRAGYLEGAVTLEHFHDLGKLLFAFTVFWAYIAFSQFFLIWYANIPEETVFFLHRLEGSWRPVTILLAVGHFAVPFFFLMPRTIKRKTGLLVTGAAWMLLMHLLDLHWVVMPIHHAEGFHLTLLDFTTLIGIGGLFLAAVGWILGRHSLVPVRDPRLAESLSFENF